MKTICFDFGNTRLKAAIFNNDEFVEQIVLPNDELFTIERLINIQQPQKTILSSVINHNPVIESFLAQKTKFHKLSHFTKANFTSPVGKPETIGADRLALAAAAVHYFPNKNNLVIGLGTCITYNFINQNNQFIGGSISPGMEMRFKAMEIFTAKLPEVKADWNFPLIGYDTKTNMQSGVIAGIAFEIEGFIQAYAEKYSNFNVVLTGGDASYFASRLKYKIFADYNFLFKGLYAL
ncbi:MAG: type III pantothenate kinase, partial [Ferruginibacter sp.]|nr:type III pantothenate kinase [Ferruginibacter sp.]